MHKQTNPPAGGQTDRKKLDVWGWMTKKSDKDKEECGGCCGGPRTASLRGKGCCGEDSDKSEKDCECC